MKICSLYFSPSGFTTGFPGHPVWSATWRAVDTPLGLSRQAVDLCVKSRVFLPWYLPNEIEIVCLICGNLFARKKKYISLSCGQRLFRRRRRLRYGSAPPSPPRRCRRRKLTGITYLLTYYNCVSSVNIQTHCVPEFNNRRTFVFVKLSNLSPTRVIRGYTCSRISITKRRREVIFPILIPQKYFIGFLPLKTLVY